MLEFLSWISLKPETFELEGGCSQVPAPLGANRFLFISSAQVIVDH